MYKYSCTCGRASHQNQFGQSQRPTRVKMLWSLVLFISLISLGRLHFHATDTCGTQKEIDLKGKRTSQSSDYNDDIIYVSGRAVDEDKDNCSHTRPFNNSWWSIDLGDVYTISCISIHNKNQRNIGMEGAQIRIGNLPVKNGTENEVWKTIEHFELGEDNVFQFDTTVSGRYVTVYNPGGHFVVLCEVKIYKAEDIPFELIKRKLTWEEALYYCRYRNADLASIPDKETQEMLAKLAKEAESPYVWLGLRYTCTLEFWFWVDDENLKFINWVENETEVECDRSAAMEKVGDNKWVSKPDDEMYNFICTK